MEAVMILLGEKIDWPNIRLVISDVGNFLSRLENYDVMKTADALFNKIRTNYISKPDFEPNDVKKKSVAAASMCFWVRAINNYAVVLKKVEPKKRRYQEVKSTLDAAMAILNEKQSEVQKVKDKVAALRA
jgi:dynein heavy chain